MEAVIYARLDLREINKDLLSQRVARCQKWGKKQNFRVIAVFTDRSCSGEYLDREGFTELCEFVIKRRVPIIITELSQLTTSVRDAAMIADVFDELGICVYSTRKGLIGISRLASLDQTDSRKDRKSLQARRAFQYQRSGISQGNHASAG